MKNKTLTLILALGSTAWAGTGVIHTFKQLPGGANPLAGLLTDSAGNLYGTTNLGGHYISNSCQSGCGTVFQLTPDGGGHYTLSTLYDFLGTDQDAAFPNSALVMDSAGNLYGTASYGPVSGNLGAVYELSPRAGGGWTEKVIYNFGAYSTDGQVPMSLVLDAAGNLYGTTYQGGSSNNNGTVFELSPNGTGGWTETILHNFTGPNDALPVGQLLRDAAGNLYGTTSGGPSNAPSYLGTVFELSPGPGGTWTEQVLYTFTSSENGCYTNALTFDSVGNLYGTAGCGPKGYAGLVFKLTNSAGAWTESTIHRFSTSGTNAYAPTGITIDSAGDLFVTNVGGGPANVGAIVKLAPSAGGGWTESDLHGFTDGADGATPNGLIIFGVDGNLYGTTVHAGGVLGENWYGSVYSVHP